MAGTEIEMIGIGEDNFRAEFFERFLGKALDSGLCAHGHEERRLDRAMRRGEATAARAGGIGLCYLKGKTHLRLNT